MNDARIRKQLKRQLGYIQRSCDAFDVGQVDDAIRIATAIRVLLHQTRQSTSLLSHLRADAVRLLSTCPPSQPERGARRVYFNGLATLRIEGTSAHLVAGLGRRAFNEFIPASSWWNQVVWIIGPERRLSRRDIVLAAVNRDGGAHVDKDLTVEYADLTREGAGGYYQFGISAAPKPFLNAHFVSLRQMGFEVLNSPDLVALQSDT